MRASVTRVRTGARELVVHKAVGEHGATHPRFRMRIALEVEERLSYGHAHLGKATERFGWALLHLGAIT
jgi:hypothetical protein